MSEPHEFGGPVNRPAHNARQISPGEALDGARTSGAGSDFLGLNEQLQPQSQPPPAQPAAAQQSWLLQHEEQPAFDLAPPSPAPSEDPSAMPPSAASLLNASWRETPNPTRRPRWVTPVASGALLATLGLIGLPMLRKSSPAAPEPSSAPRTRARVIEPAAPKPVAANASELAAPALDPVQADARLDRADELASESARPPRRSSDSRREAAPVNAPPPGASFVPPVEVFDPAGVWTVEGQDAQDDVDTSEEVEGEEHSGAVGADASANRFDPAPRSHESVPVEAECASEPQRRPPQVASAAPDWDRLVWLSQDLDAAQDEPHAPVASEPQTADAGASDDDAASAAANFDEGVARAVSAWLGSEGVTNAPPPVAAPFEPLEGACDEPSEVAEQAGAQDSGVALALGAWGESDGASAPPSNGSLEGAALQAPVPPAPQLEAPSPAPQAVEVPSPAPQDEVAEVRAPRREQSAGQLTFFGRRAALRDQLQRRRARQLNQAAPQEIALAAEPARDPAGASVAPATLAPTPSEQAPTEQAPIEQAPIEQAPIEQAPIEQAPTEQAPTEQAPIEQAPSVPPSSGATGATGATGDSPAQSPVVDEPAVRAGEVASGAAAESGESKPVQVAPTADAPSAPSAGAPSQGAAEEIEPSPEAERSKRAAGQARRGVPVVGPLPPQRRAGGRKPAAPQRVLQVATARDLEHVWSGTEAPLGEAQRATRLATPNVGRARVVFRTGEIFEGDLVAVGEQRIWLRTKTGELGLEAARVGSVVRIAPGDTPTLGAAGSQKLAGLQRARVKTPGGMLSGRIIEQDAERTTLITDAGARIVLRSREVEVLGEKPSVQIRP